MRKAKHILRARIAAIGRILDEWHGFRLFALLEKQKTEIVRRLHMAALCGFLIKRACTGHIGRNAAAKAIRLRQIEQGIGIALFGRQLPLFNRSIVIALGPSIDALFDIGSSGRGHQCDCHHARSCN